MVNVSIDMAKVTQDMLVKTVCFVMLIDIYKLLPPIRVAGSLFCVCMYININAKYIIYSLVSDANFYPVVYCVLVYVSVMMSSVAYLIATIKNSVCFKLKCGVGKSTVSDILKKRDAYLCEFESNTKMCIVKCDMHKQRSPCECSIW
jgi:hypothetical protein